MTSIAHNRWSFRRNFIICVCRRWKFDTILKRGTKEKKMILKLRDTSSDITSVLFSQEEKQRKKGKERRKGKKKKEEKERKKKKKRKVINKYDVIHTKYQKMYRMKYARNPISYNYILHQITRMFRLLLNTYIYRRVKRFKSECLCFYVQLLSDYNIRNKKRKKVSIIFLVL